MVLQTDKFKLQSENKEIYSIRELTSSPYMVKMVISAFNEQSFDPVSNTIELASFMQSNIGSAISLLAFHCE